jgi:hypothetical protein
MRKFLLSVLIILASFSLNNVLANDSLSYNKSNMDSADRIVNIHSVSLITRLEEIKQMDRKSMSKADKRALQLEVDAIHKDLVKTNGGIYLSVGAVLLIGLLLIILL